MSIVSIDEHFEENSKISVLNDYLSKNSELFSKVGPIIKSNLIKEVEKFYGTSITVEQIQKIFIELLVKENYELKLPMFAEDNTSLSRQTSLITEQNLNPLIEIKKGNYWQNMPPKVVQFVKKFIKKTVTTPEIVYFLQTNLEGRYNLIKTPYGLRIRLYADYTASGQELHIVHLVINSIIENYSNTHTEASHDGKFMNHLFHQAEAAILASVHADPSTHSVIPSGSGATGAIEMVQKILGTYIPPKTSSNIGNAQSISAIKSQLRDMRKLSLVLITSYEHHSNEITWRNQICDVKVVGLCDDGFLNYEELDSLLNGNTEKYEKIFVSLSAGSNVTGIKTDVKRVCSISTKYANTYLFFDYAGVGAYCDIDMRLPIDGIYISPHKFIGGPSAVGIAVIKNRIYSCDLAPTHGGGGTVDFVSDNTAIYSKNISEREKSGTPGILQTIRAGLVFMIKDMIFPYIEAREQEVLSMFFKRFGNDKRVFIFGPHEPAKRSCIVSFNIKHFARDGERILHPVFVIRLLSDLFGIQGRSGCSCAGPYGHKLLHISEEKSKRFLKWIRPDITGGDGRSFMGIKLGWARVSLHYILNDFEVNYLFDCIDFIATYGYKFLVDYVFDPVSGIWESLEEIEPPKETLGLGLLLNEKKYARNEEARMTLMRDQVKQAYELANEKQGDFELEKLDAWEDLATFYVAKGNLQNFEEINQKSKTI